MGWERKLLQGLASKYRKPCPECCNFRIGPVDRRGNNMQGKAFTKEFQAYIEQEMEAKGLLERINADRPEERSRLAKAFRDSRKGGNGKFESGKGPNVVDCPRCKGEGFLETKESELLKFLALGGTVWQAAAQRKYG